LYPAKPNSPYSKDLDKVLRLGISFLALFLGQNCNDPDLG